jgi:hypothetical protein
MENILFSTITAGVGVIFILGAVKKWDVMVGPTRLMPRLFGPSTGRTVLMVLGLLVIAFSLFLMIRGI